MGNKPSSSAKKYESQKSLTKRGSINSVLNSVDDLVPNQLNGHRVTLIKSHQVNCYISCPSCQKETINYKFDDFMVCDFCRGKLCIENGRAKIMQNAKSGIIDLIDYRPCESGRSQTIEELNQVVLSVVWESVPSDLKFASKVDYSGLMSRVLIPFFESKSRILRENMFFNVNNISFKVSFCNPSVGKISMSTFIQCYNTIYLNKPAQKVRLMPLSRNSKITLQNIKDHIAKRKYKCHLEKDQILHINGEDILITKMHPESGITKENTEFQLKNEDFLGEIKSITLMSFQDKLSFYVLKSVDIDELERALLTKVVKPYFKGVKRYVKKGSPVFIDEIEFCVHSCSPSFGVISDRTNISHSLYKSKSTFEERTLKL